VTLQPGTRLGPYEILAAIGAGGMGEVYRARDTKLNRDVALKILPEQFVADPDRVARFHREAQALASLSHPHIAVIHGFEDSSGVKALVLELVEGPTIAERLTHGRLPLDEALAVARQIAEALEVAHVHGVVHRDLKPNIKLRADGTVKVLDFGLAKLVESDQAGSPGSATELTQSPTLTTPAATLAGVILGTAAYMAPEQARGKRVDKRADIWAFGCVLYEMLTGCRAFGGDEVTDTLAFVITKDIDWNRLPADTPDAIRRLLRRCLEKHASDRLHDMADARLEIKDALGAPSATGAPIPRRSMVWPIALAAAVAGGGIVGLAVRIITRPAPQRVTRLAIGVPNTGALAISGASQDMAIARDGTRVAYVGSSGTQLFLRDLNQLEATALTGAEGFPLNPFFSPEGDWVGFFNTNGDVRKVAVTGGPPVILCGLDSGQPTGGTWSADGTIIFATDNTATGLQRCPATGGAAVVLTRPSREHGEADHAWPEFLPGDRAVLFTITSTTGQIADAQVAVLDLRTGVQKTLVRGGSHAHYVPTGHLVYGVGGALRAVAFDIEHLTVTGPPTPVLSQVVTSTTGKVDFDVARDGTLVYVAGGVQSAARTLVWVDRQGQEEPLKAPPRTYLYPRLSPDGTRIALDIRDQDNDIWLWDIARETLARVTFDTALDRFPVWTPDGRRLIFNSDRTGAVNMFSQIVDGAAPDRLTDGAKPQVPTSVSPDGTRLVFAEGDVRDLMMLTLDAQHRVQPLVQTPYTEQNGVISPDGRWMAYDSNESGSFQVYVRPFPDVASGHWQVSMDGGAQPVWSRDSRELFYLSAAGPLMGVHVDRGPSWSMSTPSTILAKSYVRGNTAAAATYDVSPDGRRFLMIKQVAGSAQTVPPTLIVVQNWTEELKRLVPTR
jgi:Tol biopolymer transport system component